MSKTLDEILSEDLGVSTVASQEKVAAAAENDQEGDEIEKLAMEIGLLEQASPESEQTETKQGHKKEASMLNSLFNEMFPSEAPVATESEKVASQDKLAEEKEAAMGALAFDEFAGRVDGFVSHLAKMAAESATASSVANDGKPAQTMKDNMEESENKIDTKPQVTNIVKAQSGAEVVGDEHQRAPAGNGEMDKKAAALRKAWLVAAIEE